MASWLASQPTTRRRWWSGWRALVAGVGGPRGSFGCPVNLPLGSRPADPHSTAVWCGNLLHSSPQPHTAGCFVGSPLFTRWSTRYCNQDLRREALPLGAAPAGAAGSHVLSTRRCSASQVTQSLSSFAHPTPPVAPPGGGPATPPPPPPPTPRGGSGWRWWWFGPGGRGAWGRCGALGVRLSLILSWVTASAATAAADCEANSASLTWAPSIFGAARFGR